MDIAEIRKKAKAQGAAAPTAGKPEPAGKVPPVSAVAEPPAEAAAAQAPEVAAAFLDEPVVSRAALDGLDRLFAITEEFALATDDTYTDFLDSRGESQSANRQYLAFHLDDEEYALDITRISEIIKVRELTDIPRVPEFILGIISLRGVVVPVFDLRRRLNLGSARMSPASRIIVSQQEETTVGLLVDSINQVVTLADDELEAAPGVLSGLDRDVVAGLGRYQGRMIILLNLKNVLDIELH